MRTTWRKDDPNEASITTREWIARQIANLEKTIEHQEEMLEYLQRQLARMRLIKEALDKAGPESAADLERRL